MRSRGTCSRTLFLLMRVIVGEYMVIRSGVLIVVTEVIGKRRVGWCGTGETKETIRSKGQQMGKERSE